MAKSNTTKYLLIAGALGVGYYLYTRSAASVVPGVSAQPSASQVALIQSWATGLTGSNAVNFQNAFPSFSAADISNLYNIITQVFNPGIAPTAAQQSFWDSFTQRVGLN